METRTIALTPEQRDILSAKVRSQRIKEALETSQHDLARQLAVDGAKQYPDHDELKAFGRVLAPPTGGMTMPVTPEVRAARKANKMWIKTHWPAYRSNWVALQAGNLLHASSSLFEEVAEHIGDLYGPDLLLTKIS